MKIMYDSVHTYTVESLLDKIVLNVMESFIESPAGFLLMQAVAVGMCRAFQLAIVSAPSPRIPYPHRPVSQLRNHQVNDINNKN